MASGQEASLAPPRSNLRSFGSKFTLLKKVHVTLLRLFSAQRSDSAFPAVIRRRGIAPPLPLPRYAPATVTYLSVLSTFKTSQITNGPVDKFQALK